MLRKAAIVMLLLGEELSADVCKHLTEEEIEGLSKEMASLGPVPTGLGEKVLDEFHQISVAAEFVTRGDVDYARRVLNRTLGADAARRIMDRVLRSFQSTAGFTSLEKADPQQRADDEQEPDQADEQHRAEATDFGDLRRVAHEDRRRRILLDRRLVERHVLDRQLVAAHHVEADGRGDEAVNLLQLFTRPRYADGLRGAVLLLLLLLVVVDDDCDRQARNFARRADHVTRRLADFEIGRLGGA